MIKICNYDYFFVELYYSNNEHFTDSGIVIFSISQSMLSLFYFLLHESQKNILPQTPSHYVTTMLFLETIITKHSNVKIME